MSVEQNIINDVLDVKAVIQDNWDDILETAHQINTLINDGLEWMEQADNLQKIKDSLSNIKIPDLDLESPIPTDLITGAMNAVKAVLDPMLDQLHQLQDDITPETLIELIADNLPNIPNIPGLAGLSMGTLKNIANAIASEGFSISLKDLPQQTGEKDSGATSTSQTEQGANQQGILDCLFAGLEDHLEEIFVNPSNVKSIENLISNLIGSLSEEVMTSLVKDFKLIKTQLESSNDFSVESLFENVEELVRQQGSKAKKVIDTFISGIENEVESLISLFSDLLKIPVDTKSELYELSIALDSKNTQPSLISIISLIASIPICLICKSVGIKEFVLPSSVFQATEDEKQALRNYGGMQLFDGFIAVIDSFSAYKCAGRSRGILSSALIDILSLTANILAQIYSKPSEPSVSPNNSYRKPLDNIYQRQKVIWDYQWFVCVGIKGLSIIMPAAYYLYKKRQILNEYDPSDSNKNTEGNKLFTEFEELANLEELLGPDNAKQAKYDSNLRENRDQREKRLNNAAMQAATIDIALTIIETASEVGHLAIFITLFVLESRTEDNYKELQKTEPGNSDINEALAAIPKKEIRDCYILDPIPGIIGGILNVYDTILSLEELNKELVEAKKDAINTRRKWLMLFQAIINGSFQFAYGGVYINTANSPQ